MTMSIEAKRRALLELRLRRRREADAEAAERDRVVAVPRESRLPCSYQQEGLWFLHQIDPTLSVYQIPFAVRLRGRLDVDAMREALTALVARHESLRTRFESQHGVPEQVIDPPSQAWPMPIVELSGDDIPAWIHAQTHLSFDLRTGPLFRSSLARIDADVHVLLMVAHHIVTDGWSFLVLTSELSELYDAATRSTPEAALAELTIQAVDHAAWQRRWLAGAEAHRQVGYWRDVLDGVPTLDFPSDRPRPAQPTGAGALHEQQLPGELTAALRDLARHEQASFLAVLLAGFLTVLGRYTGQQDLAVGSVFSGRTRSEFEPLVGFLANTLVLRNSLAGDPTFRELIRRCNDTVLGATAHQDVPFGVVVEALKPERAPGRNPLFQVSFTLQAAEVSSGGFAPGGMEVTELDTGTDRARFDLAVAAVEGADGVIDLTIEYSTELYDLDRIERLAEHFGVVMAQIVTDPDLSISECEVMSEAERGRLVDDWNPVPVPGDGRGLHELVAAVVAEAPDRVAMRFAGGDLSYSELGLASSRLANLLAGAGVRPGRVVGVLLERGFDLPVAELGVLKAGGAWLPLDPQYPAERIAYQLSDADVRLVVTTSDLAGRLPGWVSSVLLDSGVLDGQPDTAPVTEVGPEDIAYVIYTSGSTGKPKGVAVPHRAVVNFCVAFGELFAVTPDDRILQFSNPAFDVSVSDFFATFAAGATVVGAPRSVLLDPDALQALIRDEKVTFGDIPPAILRLLDPGPLVDLRVLFIGMEPYGPELVNRWARPGREFHNGYGPTEATITCVDYLCPDEALTAQPPIGRAMANQRAYVLDKHLRLAPIGVPGQLYMAGAGLAHGYLHRTDLTAEKFIPDPFARTPGERMYATGDLARWRADGNIEFLGRVDRQVKIRGMRIEPGEIEHAVNTWPGVRHCAVIVREPGTPQAYLAAYVVSEPDSILDGHKLRDYLADRLPLHMIPTVLSLNELPLTASGKLDQARLPAPEPSTAHYTPPETATQRHLAQMWQDLLKVDAGQIGVDDNFFVQGGNSLQAIQLIAQIRDAFQVTLDPRQLIVQPGLGQLAAQIDQLRQLEPDCEVAAVRRPMSALVAINPEGTRPPLFFVHAVGGSVAPYVALASLIDADQPFYGLEHPGLRGGTAARTIPEIAASYLDAIREVRPAGPFYLGGWSLGGVVAMEMASQLQAGGEEVAVVVALDSGLPTTTNEPDQAELLSWFVSDLAGLAASEPPPIDLTALRQLPAREQVDATLEALIAAGLESAALRQELRNRIEIFSANCLAFLAHRPDRYDGRLVLLTAAEEPDDDVERWRALAPTGFEHHVVPGNHYTLLRPPHLSTVAEAVRRCLYEPGTGW